MNQPTKTYNYLLLRVFSILLHALINFSIVSYLTDLDLTGSWIVFIGFVIVVFFLSFVFLKHLVSFIHYIKNK